MSYTPIYSLTETMFSRAIEIAERVGELREHRVLLDMRLRKANRVRSIYASCAIENNSLTLEEVTAIIDGHPVLGKPHDILEIQNALSAYEQFEQYRPYDLNDFLNAHRRMTQTLVAETGQFRTRGVGISNGKTIIHQGAPSQNVPALMASLLTWAEHSPLHPMLKSCIVHYEIENIHPFADGNGRMGRLWQSVILSQWHEVFRHLPIESLIYTHQRAYYEALQQSHICGHCNDFIEFMLGMMLEALDELIATWKVGNRE